MAKPHPCEHRGSQRRANCCNNKLISRWICRERKQSDGTTPMDCVLTAKESKDHMEHAPSAMHATWTECVAICENCPLYKAK